MTTAAPQAPTDLTAYLFGKLHFSPTPEQAQILACNKRFILVAGGDQSGKSMVASKMFLIRESRDLQPGQKGLYWLVAADYNRTRREFEYIVEDLTALGVLKYATKRVDPGYIELYDGTRIETKSASDPRTLAMSAPNGIIVCEASQVDLETYYRVSSRVGPRRGWLFLSGTFETSLGWYPTMFSAWQVGNPEAQSFSLPSWSNIHLYPGGQDDPEIRRMKAASPDEWFMERIAGVPMPPAGLVFSEFRPLLHLPMDAEGKSVCVYDDDQSVYLWIDPGYAGAYAVEAIQVIDGQTRVFDEIYQQGLTTDDIIEVVQNRPWFQKVIGGVIDIAGYQHQALAAPAEIWLAKAGVYLNAEKIRIADGTDRMKFHLKPDPITGQPKLVFNPVCRGILSEFGYCSSPFDGQTHAYRWKMDNEGNIIGQTPRDEYNHGIKAVIYGLIHHFGYVKSMTRDLFRMKRWS